MGGLHRRAGLISYYSAGPLAKLTRKGLQAVFSGIKHPGPDAGFASDDIRA